MIVIDPGTRRATVIAALEGAGYAVTAAEGMYDGLRIAQRTIPNVIVADLALADGDSRAFIRALRAISNTARVPVIAIAGRDALGADVSAKGLLVDAVLDHDADVDALLTAVTRAQGRRTLADVAPDMRWDTPAGGLSVVAADGTKWSVHHVSGQDGRTKETLMFVSRAGYLRVADFPEDWRSLPTEQLLALGAPRAR
jgi:DNA-binding response OmpR family regulator